jgi:type I restriction enzyme S subunit
MVNNQVPLNEFITLQRGFDLPKHDRIEGEVPVVASTGIGGYHNESKVLAPGVVIGRSGSIGGGQYIEDDFWPLNTTLWVKDFKGHNPRFVYYLLKSIDFSIFNVGSGVPTLNRNHLNSILVNKLGRSVEDEVAVVLGNLDDKINLITQTNQTLEQMAQALFKSWFIDFDPVIYNAFTAGNYIPEALQHKAEKVKQAQQLSDFKPLPDDIRALFPSEFEQTDEPNIGISGWVPKGWLISNIDECCSHIIDHRGKTPKKLGGDWSDSGFAAISAKNVKDGQIVRPDTIRFVDDDLYKKWMKEPLQPKDIIMTSEAPMGEMYFLAEKAEYLLSQRLYGMRADIEMTTGEYLYYWLQTTTARADLEGRATGTTVTGIRQVELKKVIVLLPRLSIVNKFSKIVEGFLVRKEHNRNQNSNLEEIRDYLLPKLISGEIKLVKVD